MRIQVVIGLQNGTEFKGEEKEGTEEEYESLKEFMTIVAKGQVDFVNLITPDGITFFSKKVLETSTLTIIKK